MSCVLLSKRIDAYQTGKQLLAKISVDDTSVLNDSTENIITLVTCVKNQPNYRWCRLDRSSIDVNNFDKKKVIHIDVKNFT